MSTSLARAASALLLVLLAGVAAADPLGGEHGPPAVREPRIMMAHESRPEQHSLAEAVRRVERATGGQILSAERVPFDGRDLNRIKVVDSTGRVRVITEDPRATRGSARGD